MKQIALTVAFMACSLPGMAGTIMGMDSNDAMGFFAITLSFGLPMFIVFMVLWFSYKNKKAKYKLASQALTCGQSIPKELFQEQSKSEENKDILSKGIKNAFLGIGLAIMLWCFTENPGVTSVGILILCIGLGQIVVAYTTRDKNPNNSTDIERL